MAVGSAAEHGLGLPSGLASRPGEPPLSLIEALMQLARQLTLLTTQMQQQNALLHEHVAQNRAVIEMLVNADPEMEEAAPLNAHLSQEARR